MRLAAWNCNMALDRKVEGLLAPKPDIGTPAGARRRSLD